MSGKDITAGADEELRGLMVAYQQGDLTAFDRLYRRLAPCLRGYLGSLVRDPARTADLVQETFLQLHRSRRVWALAIGTVTLITMVTWRVSPTPLLQHGLGFVWRVCVAGTYVSAMPALALSLLLIRRAFPLRPAVAGALCGVGSGLLADSGWRMFCHFTDPAHVFGAHMFAVAAVTVTGALFARRS